MKSFIKLNDYLWQANFDLFNTHCFIIRSKSRLFVVDTFMGPDSVKELKKAAYELAGGRPVSVINTHSHYDHVWGNCLFDDSEFISHNFCRQNMLISGEDELKNYPYPEQIAGNVELVLPDITFTDNLTFYDNDINIVLEWFPGHSKDSLIIWIEPMHICIAGDSVEDPLVLVQKISEYEGPSVLLKNLKLLKEKKPALLLPSHGSRTDGELLTDNIFYLEKLIEFSGNLKDDECTADKFLKSGLHIIDPFYIEAHSVNLKSLQKIHNGLT